MKKKFLLLLFVSTVFLLSFSIFTNSGGYPRRYNVGSIPLTIRVNESVNSHPGWYDAITDGADE